MKAFIFDMDGVIIDSEPIHSRVKLDTFRHFGLPFEESKLINYMGRSSKDLFTELLAENGRTDISVQEITAYKHEHYLEILKSGEDVKAIPGTLELIERLYERKIPLALATSSWVKVVGEVLSRFHLEGKFQSVLSGSELPKSKPDPAIYLLSAERLGVNPAACVVLEDTKSGVLAAKAAGMTCIGFQSPHSGNQDLSKADFIVTRMEDIDIDGLGF